METDKYTVGKEKAVEKGHLGPSSRNQTDPEKGSGGTCTQGPERDFTRKLKDRKSRVVKE